ncbi:MAG: DUF3619 family protein [Candidatus Thiodiazotropha sp.]
MKSDEQQFLAGVKQRLDDHANDVDRLTAARLQAARKTALEGKSRSALGWLPVTGSATAATLLLALALWYQTGSAPAPQFSEDWELLASSEELELIEELEFYNWLELMHGES